MPATPPAAPAAGTPGKIAGPTGPGWVIELKGYHYFNENPETWGGTHVRNTFLKNLREQVVELPSGPGGALEKFTMEEMGIEFGVLAQEWRIVQDFKIPNPYYEPPAGPAGTVPGMEGFGPRVGLGALGGGEGAAKKPAVGDDKSKIAPGDDKSKTAPGDDKKKVGPGDDKKKVAPGDESSNPRFFVAPKYSFIVQFCWREKLLTERMQQRRQKAQQAAGNAPAVAAASTGG